MSSLPPPTPVADTPPSWWKRKLWKLPVWAWITIVVVLIAAASTSTSTSTSEDDAPAATPTPAATTPPSEATTPAVTEPAETTPVTDAPVETDAPTTVPPTEPPATLPGFNEGVNLVGTDMQPGLYLTVVPDSSFNCYWARLSGVSGDFEEILANDNTSAGDHVVIEVKASDVAFESDGCGRWSVYLPPEAPAATFGDGTWLVGPDIAPGRYRSTGPEPDGNCYWARMSGVSGDFEELLANDNQSVGTIVEIRPGDVAFKATGCGTWTAA